METMETSENIALLIVIAMIIILGACAVDLIFYKLLKNIPKKKKSKSQKEKEKLELDKINVIEKELAELEELDEISK